MDPIKVFLGIPTGEPIVYTDTAVDSEHAGGDGVEIVVKANVSWTGSNFNALWAMALDGRDAGQITHFAMLHSDVAPGRQWVAKLAAEMAAGGYSVVSAVVPIKDLCNDRTSTAVGSRSNPWGEVRHITSADYLRLPPTFTTADVAQSDDDVLLINNGCMLIDLRRPWCDDWVFQWQVRITKRETGQRHVGFRPEDWEMARLLDARGEPYAATSVIVPSHWGPWCFRMPERPVVVSGDVKAPAAVDIPC